jgi:hypothetical protein
MWKGNGRNWTSDLIWDSSLSESEIHEVIFVEIEDGTRPAKRLVRFAEGNQ